MYAFIIAFVSSVQKLQYHNFCSKGIEKYDSVSSSIQYATTVFTQPSLPGYQSHTKFISCFWCTKNTQREKLGT